MITLSNPYGYYDEERREYVITRPDTPTPWINYLGEGRYGGIISNTAGGYSFDRDPKNRRVTRYRYNGIPADQPGRYIYLRDQESGEYWSPTWQPVTSRKLESYECRHGAAYTRITSRYQGIRVEVLYFVPPSPASDPAPCELWVVKVKNESDRARSLRSFSYVEFLYPDALIDMTNLDWGAHILFTRYESGVLYTTTKFNPATTFFSSSLPEVGFDSDREVFLGRYRDLSNPEVVQSGAPRNSQAPRANNIGSLCHEWFLQPGEEKQIVYILGVTDDRSAAMTTITHYRDAKKVEESFRALKADWEAYLSRFTVETPDLQMNAMLNFWNQVQCRATLYWSRFVSYYETGLGRGMGTRDSAQDTLGTVHTVPDRARSTLTMLWKLQFQDGHAWHQVMPLTGEGGVGLAAEFPGWPQWFSDDHLYLVMAVCGYLRETGDFHYLDEVVSYADGGEDSVWNHMLRAVDFTLQHRGPHGLPRAGFSDWDDTMNLDHGSGKAESVMVAQQFCRTMLDLADLCDAIEKFEDAQHFKVLKEEMAALTNQYAWDGEWYARAYDDDGNPVGVRGETFHEINMNTQTWAVIGEVAPPDRAAQAMESMHGHLNTSEGIALMHPPYDGTNLRVRGTSTYPPGSKENGGIFCHANTWAMVAAAMLGWNERAYQYYQQVMPLNKGDYDHYQVEPYVYCQNVCGPTHPLFGRGRNAWLTGTAAWTYVAGTQFILGIRPTFKGLMVQPAIPAEWKGFSATRVFRDTVYLITVERVGPGNSVSLLVNGKRIAGNVVPFQTRGGKDVVVQVTLQ
jgi:cellobiose phosphorylase